MERYRYAKIGRGCLFAFDPKTQITLKLLNGKWGFAERSFDILSFDDEFEELTILEAKEIYGDNEPTQAFKAASKYNQSVLGNQLGEDR